MNVRNPNQKDWFKALEGRPMGLPACFMPPEMLRGLPESVRARLQMRADISRQKMEAAEKRAASVRAAERKHAQNVRSSENLTGVACRYNVVFANSSLMEPGELPVLLRPGCFQDSLRGSVAFRAGHFKSALARSGDGHFALTDSAELGLFFSLRDMHNSPESRAFIGDVRSGRLAECSTEMEVLEEHTGRGCRVITRARLVGIAATAPGRAACPDTYLRLN